MKIHKGGERMYPNLKAEMARRKVTQSELAKQLNITIGTMSLKLNGKSNFDFDECTKIKSFLGTEKSLEYLFKKED